VLLACTLGSGTQAVVVPQATAPIVPTLPAKPVISSFTANVSAVIVGGVVILRWSFSGQDIASARLTCTNPDGSQTPLYGGADVTSPGTFEDLAVYTLQVSSEFSGSTTAAVTVNGITQ